MFLLHKVMKFSGNVLEDGCPRRRSTSAVLCWHRSTPNRKAPLPPSSTPRAIPPGQTPRGRLEAEGKRLSRLAGRCGAAGDRRCSLLFRIPVTRSKYLHIFSFSNIHFLI